MKYHFDDEEERRRRRYAFNVRVAVACFILYAIFYIVACIRGL